MKTLGRRTFIKGAAILSGATLCGAVNTQKAEASQQVELPPLPWGYAKLDPEELRKLGHLGYYAFECAGGAFWALVTALKETVGYPYTALAMPTKEEVIDYLKNKKKGGAHLPQAFMQYGVGGVGNYGTLCGAPNGAASLMNIAVPFKEVKKELIPRLLRYYETEGFPTDLSNQYAVNKEFYPPKYKSGKALPQVVGDSVLCHVSVGTWCEKSGYASGSKERSERCGRITGDIAAMTVKMLNASMDGNLATVFPMSLSQETAECRTCHSKGKEYETGQFTRGAMECGSCHDEDLIHKGENKLNTAYGVEIGTWAGAAVIGTAAGIGGHAVASRMNKEDNDEE